jgi:hypothetical protein
MTYLKLYRGSDIVGIITNPIQEGPETIAGLKFTEAASKWKELFQYMINDIDTTQDPPSELNVFEDWYIEDENGNKNRSSCRECLRAVHICHGAGKGKLFDHFERDLKFKLQGEANEYSKTLSRF